MTTTRIGLLSKSKDLHATRRLIEAGEAQGHRVDFLPILECVILSDSKGSALHVAGAPVGRPDVVIGRVGTFMTSLGLAALRAFERMGVPCVNSSDAMARSRDKQQTIERLTEHGIAIPSTAFVKDLDRIEQTVCAVGGPPVVIKPVGGTQGQGVVLADSMPAACSMIEAFLYLNRDVQVQRFLGEAAGGDYRVFVVAGEIVGAVERQAAEGDFRGNHHRGAKVTDWTPDTETARLALRAARALELDVAGIDLLSSLEGPVVLEANGAPGLEGIERATGSDIASRIIDAAIAQSGGCRFDD